jgi:pimeloyl-ACP methyl ester carboxylesterase
MFRCQHRFSDQSMRTALLLIAALVSVLAILFVAGRIMIAHVETADAVNMSALPGARFIRLRTGRVHYLDVGEGPPILLMHGSGRSIVDWQQGVVQGLARHHRVIAFDYYGNGFSDRSAAFQYGYDLWVNEAVDLLDALHVDHVTVVGQSVGGAVACLLAAEHPDRVDHVVTIGTGLTIEPQQFLPAIPGVGEVMLARVLSFGETYGPSHRAALEASFRIKGTRSAMLEYIRRQMTFDGSRLMFGVFEDIRAPVLQIHGANDRHIPVEVGRALTRRTHARFVVVENVGHNVHIEAPDRTVREIESFVGAQ